MEEESKEVRGSDADGFAIFSVRLTQKEIDELKRRADVNMRGGYTLEAAWILRTVLQGRGEPVTVPGVNEFQFGRS